MAEVDVEFEPGEGEHPGEPAPGSYRVTLPKRKGADGRPKRTLYAGELPGQGRRALFVRLQAWGVPEGLAVDAVERELVLDALARECPAAAVFEEVREGLRVARRLPEGEFRVQACRTGTPGEGELLYYERDRTMAVPALLEVRTIHATDALLDRRRARWLHPAEGEVSDADWVRVAANLGRAEGRLLGNAGWRLLVPSP
jgi:hypothetical protein